jgi:uncharacterized protein (DUF4213/DUF364 family)
MKDPVSVLLENFPYDAGKILASSCGKAYVSIMLANGQIGVCSTADQPVETDPLLLKTPDLTRADHRMLVTAYSNAHINYNHESYTTGDIFDQVDFNGNSNTVMIGYFPPLVDKFKKAGLPLTVFDQIRDYPELTPVSQLPGFLKSADSVILTASSMVNSTFTDILASIKPGAAVFLLGPSTPLYPMIKGEFSITGLFGMVFKPYDFELLEIIGRGLGTRAFSKKSKKVSL